MGSLYRLGGFYISVPLWALLMLFPLWLTVWALILIGYVIARFVRFLVIGILWLFTYSPRTR